jgi:hypothetical protein
MSIVIAPEFSTMAATQFAAPQFSLSIKRLKGASAVIRPRQRNDLARPRQTFLDEKVQNGGENRLVKGSVKNLGQVAVCEAISLIAA